MMDNNEDLDYVIPEEGSNLFIDSMCIPTCCKHKENAELFINFMCEPEIAAENAAYIYYGTPNKEALELMDEDYLESELTNPPEEYLDKCYTFTNLDDKNGTVMVQNCRGDIKNYSTRTLCDYRARLVETHLDGMLLEFNNREFATLLTGRFNISNLLAIYGAAIELGKDPEEVLRIMSTLKPVSGRFEALHSPEGFSAIVDYAHTPDAIKNVLSTVNDVLRGRGNIIPVVGAGGNRDKGKRPLMAAEAAKASGRVILTSDNPRNEEPQDIINDMLAGLNEEQRKKTICIVDRKEAIRTACALAQKGDVVVVAGKGHENYQEIQGVKHHFDDKEVLNEIFNQ